MKKLISLMILAAFTLAACGGGSGEVAATVDGSLEVTVADVETLIDTGDESTIPKDQFARFLGFWIQWLIIEEAAARDFGFSFTDEEIAAEIQVILQRNAEEGTTKEEFLASNGITEEFLENVAHQQLLDVQIRLALGSELERPAQADIDAQMENAVRALTEVCARHLLVETEEEANDVLARLDDGEVFEDLAVELSLDTGSGANGGDLNCASPTRYVPSFADAAMSAEIDVPTDPVESQFGFHVILVYDRIDPTPESLPTEQEIIDVLNDTALSLAMNDWFLSQVSGASVEVNEKYGTWQTDPAPGVVAPSE